MVLADSGTDRTVQRTLVAELKVTPAIGHAKALQTPTVGFCLLNL
jgi:hypothetical protein